MSIWTGSSAIVTGAASGIGLALAEAMVARGGEVWLTDVDDEAGVAAAARLGDHAHWERLDVRHAGAVRKLVEEVAQAHGRLDFLFNNAGIGIAAEAQEVGAEHYDRVLDVNVRGVSNGVAAAYPLMVRQGRGRIVNTASAAGLVPVPLMAAYAMSKHAVVGLSRSLRLEGEPLGVKVHVLCPAAVETPLIDRPNPEDLAAWRPDIRSYLTQLAGAPMPADRFAAAALAAIERDRGVIVLPARARFSALVARLFPGLIDAIAGRALAQQRAKKG